MQTDQQRKPMVHPHSNYQAARWYLEHGYSVIPVKKSNKRPFIKWAEFQKRLPTHEEIKEWWSKWPDANLALITGEISGIMVVDCDSKEHLDRVAEFIPDSLVFPIAKTLKEFGYHYYFKYRQGLTSDSDVGGISDVKTDGGYIIAPPSKNESGKSYHWLKGLKISDVDIPVMPEMLFDTFQQISGNAGFLKKEKATGGTEYPVPGIDIESNFLKDVTRARVATSMPDENLDNKRQHLTTSNNISFLDGARDKSLFHVANCLIKGGMNEANACKCLEILGLSCEPSFPKNELKLKIKSAMDRAKKRDIGLTHEIREWVLTTNGNFSTTFVYNSLNLTTSNNKKKAAVILGRLKEEGIIERIGDKRGEYRLIERDVEFLDITKAAGIPIEIKLPLNLSHFTKIYNGDIIALAGSPNTGKSAFMLWCARYNFKKFKVRYLTSEMMAEEALVRIRKFDDITPEEWQRNWEFIPCYGDYQDKLLTGIGNINIIDYVELDEAYKVPNQLKMIHQKLDGAIAIIALQKNFGKGRITAVGGDQTVAKPRLYIAMDYGWAKIVKCKSWDEPFGNPNHMECNFKLAGGHHFVNTTDWRRVEKNIKRKQS